MIEELYVIKEGNQYRLDLLSPSGLIVTYNSNLFNDLSKIDSSKSYTFRIPNTANNSRIFDMIEEMGHRSAMFGKRMQCRYYYNGVEICRNARLYISEVGESGEYSAVMVWDAIQGLIDMSENDVSLRDLEDFTETADYGEEEITDERYKAVNYISANNVCYPMYSAGEMNLLSATPYIYRTSLFPLAPPVVPIYKILRKIEDRYGLTFNFKKQCDGQELIEDMANSKTDLLKHGVLPMIKTEMSEHWQQETSCSIDGVSLTNYGTLYGVDNVLSFSGGSVLKPDYIDKDRSRGVCGFRTHIPFMSVRVDGYLKLGFSSRYDGETPKITFWSAPMPRTPLDPIYLGDLEPVELASVEGEFDSVENGSQMFLFDFRATEGKANVMLDKLESFEATKRVIVISTNYEVVANSNAYGSFTMFATFDEGVIGHKCDVFRNLPNISCLTFLKSLFYMVGGFPRLENDGSLSISYFNDLKKNIEQGNILDWSGKCLGGDLTKDKISFTNGHLAVKNYYLMANDKFGDGDDPTKDKYENSFGVLECQNLTLDRSQTIYQMPYNGRFLRSAKSPKKQTGRTIKYFDRDKGELIAGEAQPAYGLLKTLNFQNGQDYLMMEVWQFPNEMTTDENYSYLQQIIAEPYVIEKDLRLTEIDLMELDYRKPIYFRRYNQYFAVVKIQFSSTSGISKATLIKLPNI